MHALEPCKYFLAYLTHTGKKLIKNIFLDTFLGEIHEILEIGQNNDFFIDFKMYLNTCENIL